LIDVSIMVEPSLTTRPPMRLSSTVTFSLTVLADGLLQRLGSQLCGLRRSARAAEVTSAVTSPFSSAIMSAAPQDRTKLRQHEVSGAETAPA
jgi:hypothetical protein